MIFARFDQEAESASVRYGMLTDSWRSSFMRALNAMTYDFGRATDQAIEEAYAVAQSFLEDERDRIERILTEIAGEAHQTTLTSLRSIDSDELSEAALEHLYETQRYLIDEIAAQMQRDIALLRQTLQRVTLEVGIAARGRGIEQRTALVEYRIGNQAELQFMFHDRHARKWPSKKFVRAIWRHTLLATYNEAVLMTIADHGLTRAVVQHQDAGAQSHGAIVSFGSNSEHPTYSEIRNEVFHPNANAILAVEDAHVPA